VSRFIAMLALLSLALLGATLVIGLDLGDLQQVTHQHRDATQKLVTDYALSDGQRQQIRDRIAELEAPLQAANVHRLFGVGSALVVVLVSSILVTYFIGTGRWCKEVSAAYNLPPTAVERTLSLKRRTYPWAILATLAMIAVTSLGALADPLADLLRDESWVISHRVAAFASIAVVAAAFYFGWMNVTENHAVIQGVMAQVRRIRQERGLPVEEEANRA
jgi:hypothetical protein